MAQLRPVTYSSLAFLTALGFHADMQFPDTERVHGESKF
jgi:hypothetical protein